MFIYILKCKNDKYNIRLSDKVLDKPLEYFSKYDPVEVLGYLNKDIFIAQNIVAQFIKQYGISNVEFDDSLKNENKETFTVIGNYKESEIGLCITCQLCQENGHSAHTCPYDTALKCANCPKADHTTVNCPLETTYQYWS